MFRTEPEIVGYNIENDTISIQAVCQYHETPASFIKTITSTQLAEINSGEKYFAQIFFNDENWNLADIELFFISGMCDDCWKKMCDEDDLEEIAAAEMAYADSAEMSYEELKREAITADRFDYDPEPYEESDEDYKS